MTHPQPSTPDSPRDHKQRRYGDTDKRTPRHQVNSDPMSAILQKMERRSTPTRHPAPRTPTPDEFGMLRGPMSNDSGDENTPYGKPRGTVAFIYLLIFLIALIFQHRAVAREIRTSPQTAWRVQAWICLTFWSRIYFDFLSISEHNALGCGSGQLLTPSNGLMEQLLMHKMLLSFQI